MHVPSALLNSLLQPSEAIDAALAGLSSKWRNYVIRLLLQFYSKSAVQFCMGDHWIEWLKVHLHLVDDWWILSDHLLGSPCSHDHGRLCASQGNLCLWLISDIWKIVIYLRHYCFITSDFPQCFAEIINIGYAVYKMDNLPWFRSLSWFVQFEKH